MAKRVRRSSEGAAILGSALLRGCGVANRVRWG
jgi:hypothetical protein